MDTFVACIATNSFMVLCNSFPANKTRNSGAIRRYYFRKNYTEKVY